MIYVVKGWNASFIWSTIRSEVKYSERVHIQLDVIVLVLNE